jgi:hypothetical protein
MNIKLSSKPQIRKLDLRKELKPFMSPHANKVELVEIPRFQFAMIDGEIEPGHGPGTSPAFSEALEALYGISYTLKFMLKLREADPIDYPVCGLEGLWWVEGTDFDILRPNGWCYTVMIMQPDLITPELYQDGLSRLKKKRGSKPGFDRMRLESFQEGLCVQTMHIGPYSKEMETIARMDAFSAEKGYRKTGKHHEIYMGDPRRAAPDKLKTILRHPVEKI